MEFLILLIKWTLAPLISIVVTLVFSEPLKDRLAPLVTSLGTKKEYGVSGLWKATFFYGKSEEPHIQVIQLSTLLGSIVGRIVPHEFNEGAAKRTENSRPLRVRGSIKDNRIFTGIWFHPEKRSHHHGAFNLIIRQDNEHMEGMWLGYSEKDNLIETGRWTWERLNS